MNTEQRCQHCGDRLGLHIIAFLTSGIISCLSPDGHVWESVNKGQTA